MRWLSVGVIAILLVAIATISMKRRNSPGKSLSSPDTIVEPPSTPLPVRDLGESDAQSARSGPVAAQPAQMQSLDGVDSIIDGKDLAIFSLRMEQDLFNGELRKVEIADFPKEDSIEGYREYCSPFKITGETLPSELQGRLEIAIGETLSYVRHPTWEKYVAFFLANERSLKPEFRQNATVIVSQLTGKNNSSVVSDMQILRSLFDLTMQRNVKKKLDTLSWLGIDPRRSVTKVHVISDVRAFQERPARSPNLPNPQRWINSNPAFDVTTEVRDILASKGNVYVADFAAYFGYTNPPNESSGNPADESSGRSVMKFRAYYNPAHEKWLPVSLTSRGGGPITFLW